MINGYKKAGTYSYMAPEVLTGTLTVKSDIWSAGVLMMLLMTGHNPFRGFNQDETIRFVKNKVVNFQQACFKNLTICAKELLERMLHRNLHKRISAADALQSSWF